MSLDSNHKAFLDMELSQYSGEWIAISGGQIVTHDKNFLELVTAIDQMRLPEPPLFASVPKCDLLLF